MRIESAFVANHVESHAGMFYAHGAFAAVAFVPELPCTRPLPFGIVVELADDEVGDTFALDVRLRGPDGTVLQSVDMVLWVELTGIDDAPNFLLQPGLMTAELQTEGLHLLEFARFEDILYTVRFSVTRTEEGF